MAGTKKDDLKMKIYRSHHQLPLALQSLPLHLLVAIINNQQQHQYDSSNNNLSRMKNTISNTFKLTGPYPA
jgi:hypothetical protein